MDDKPKEPEERKMGAPTVTKEPEDYNMKLLRKKRTYRDLDETDINGNSVYEHREREFSKVVKKVQAYENKAGALDERNKKQLTTRGLINLAIGKSREDATMEDIPEKIDDVSKRSVFHLLLEKLKQDTENYERVPEFQQFWAKEFQYFQFTNKSQGKRIQLRGDGKEVKGEDTEKLKDYVEKLPEEVQKDAYEIGFSLPFHVYSLFWNYSRAEMSNRLYFAQEFELVTMNGDPELASILKQPPPEDFQGNEPANPYFMLIDKCSRVFLENMGGYMPIFSPLACFNMKTKERKIAPCGILTVMIAMDLYPLGHPDHEIAISNRVQVLDEVAKRCKTSALLVKLKMMTIEESEKKESIAAAAVVPLPSDASNPLKVESSSSD